MTATIENYTPRPYIERVEAAFGTQIDLDPASCELAQRLCVRAKRAYFQRGLVRSWVASNLWLNPPYGVGLTTVWTTRLRRAVTHGEVPEACTLLPVKVDTAWFRAFYGSRWLFAFVDHRIRFVQADGSLAGNGWFASVFIYYGPNNNRFADAFSDIAHVSEMRTFTY